MLYINKQEEEEEEAQTKSAAFVLSLSMYIIIITNLQQHCIWNTQYYYLYFLFVQLK